MAGLERIIRTHNIRTTYVVCSSAYWVRAPVSLLGLYVFFHILLSLVFTYFSAVVAMLSDFSSSFVYDKREFNFETKLSFRSLPFIINLTSPMEMPTKCYMGNKHIFSENVIITLSS